LLTELEAQLYLYFVHCLNLYGQSFRDVGYLVLRLQTFFWKYQGQNRLNYARRPSFVISRNPHLLVH